MNGTYACMACPRGYSEDGEHSWSLGGCKVCKDTGKVHDCPSCEGRGYVGE